MCWSSGERTRHALGVVFKQDVRTIVQDGSEVIFAMDLQVLMKIASRVDCRFNLLALLTVIVRGIEHSAF